MNDVKPALPNCFYRVSVKALIRDAAGRILLVGEHGGDLSLPGGGMDWGENAHECLVRELHEEIGLKSSFQERLIHQQTIYLEEKQAWLMWLTYEIDYNELDFSIGADGDEVQWLSSDELKADTKAFAMIRNVLKEYEGA